MKIASFFRYVVLCSTMLIGVPIAAAAAAGLAPNYLKMTTMAALSPRLAQIFAETKAICFCRFVIDVPETAVVVFGRMTVDFELSHLVGEADAADMHIAKQVLKLEKDDFLYKNMNTPGSLYGKVVNDGIAGQTTFVGAGGNSYRISSYVPIGGDLFIF